jgi:hypothetical protein
VAAVAPGVADALGPVAADADGALGPVEGEVDGAYAAAQPEAIQTTTISGHRRRGCPSFMHQ